MTTTLIETPAERIDVRQPFDSKNNWSDEWGNPSEWPDFDVYRIYPSGKAAILSNTVSRLTGQRNEYEAQMCWASPAHGLAERYLITDCGTPAFFRYRACRHSLMLTKIANAPAIMPYLNAGAEVRWAHMDTDTQDSAGHLQICIMLYAPAPLPGYTGYGYLRLQVCANCGLEAHTQEFLCRGWLSASDSAGWGGQE